MLTQRALHAHRTHVVLDPRCTECSALPSEMQTQHTHAVWLCTNTNPVVSWHTQIIALVEQAPLLAISVLIQDAAAGRLLCRDRTLLMFQQTHLSSRHTQMVRAVQLQPADCAVPTVAALQVQSSLPAKREPTHTARSTTASRPPLQTTMQGYSTN